MTLQVKVVQAKDSETFTDCDQYTRVLQVWHEGKVLFEECDCMEPEDATFGRDLSWVPKLLTDVYKLGQKDGFLAKALVV